MSYQHPKRTVSTMADATVQPWMARKHLPGLSREALTQWLMDAGVADRTVTTQLGHFYAGRTKSRPTKNYGKYDEMTKQQWLDFIEATRA